MSWRHDPISDLDLMAYADGQLDAARRQTVEAHLAAHPEDAAMVEAIMAQNAALRTTLAGIAEEPVPERLKAVLERDPRSLWRPTLQAASVLVLVTASGAGGWWIGQGGNVAAVAPPAFLAHLDLDSETGEVMSIESTGAVPALAEEAVQLSPTWLSGALSLRLVAPDLGATFSAPELQRLVDVEGRPTVLFALDDTDGRRLSLYLQTRPATAPAQVRLVEGAGAALRAPAAYWQDGPLVWALTGDAQGADLRALAERIAMAIELVPALGAVEAELTRQADSIEPVQVSAEEMPALPVPLLQPLPIELAGG